MEAAFFCASFLGGRYFLAGAGGFEPPHGGIKIRCLTAWLRPNAVLLNIVNLEEGKERRRIFCGAWLDQFIISCVMHTV